VNEVRSKEIVVSTVLITGASSGIGRAAASRISSCGTVRRIRARGKSAYCDDREQRLYKASFE